MTVYVISVGLSLTNALERPRGEPGLTPAQQDAVTTSQPASLLAAEGIGDLASDRERASEWIARAITEADSAPGKRLRDVAQAITPHEWPSGISAELDTFARVQDKHFTLDRTDIAVLICSDTRDGLLAGLWNAIAMANGDLRRVRYVGDLDGASCQGLQLRGSVVLARVAGMAAGDAGFRDAMRGLGLLARQVFKSGNLGKGEKFEFILSGGYKAAIPFLIGLAEAVRSVDDQCLRDLGAVDLLPAPEPYPVKAYVQHETAGRNTRPIELPLRRFVADSVRQELSGFDQDGVRKDKPDPAYLLGYAFEVERAMLGGKRYRLTPFGEGLRALLGTQHLRAGG